MVIGERVAQETPVISTVVSGCIDGIVGE